MLRNLLCAYCFLGFLVCGAQGPYKNTVDFKFKTYTTTQGLADNIVVKTVKDKYGFLWIATHNGISRFDGLSFKQYTHNPTDSTSLRSIWISDLVIDDSKTLWASTEYGICYFDEIKDRFIYINPSTEVQLVFKIPLCKDDNQTIWIAAEDGLRKLNTRTKKYVSTSLKQIADPQFVLVVSKTELLIGTRGKGLYKFNKDNNSVRKLAIKELPVDVHFMDAIQDDTDSWIATGEGLLKLAADETSSLFNTGTGEMKGTNVTQLMCVKKFVAGLGESKIMCGTYDKRLLLFDKNLLAFSYQFKSSNNNRENFKPAIVYNIEEDKKMLWVGTNRGLLLANLENKQQDANFIAGMVQGNNNALVRKIVPGRNSLWMIPLHPYNGIIQYDRAGGHIKNEWGTTTSARPKKYTDVIFSARSNSILAARDSAIDFYDERKGFLRTLAVKVQINCVEEDNAGNLWVGHSGGIIYVDTKKGTQQQYVSDFKGTEVEQNSFGGSFPVNSIKIIDDLLWLASIKYGLFSFNTGTKKFTAYRQPFQGNFSTLNRSSSIAIGSRDSIWEGTMAGLSCYIPSQKKFLNFNAATGLRSTYIYSIVQDSDQNIWARGNADLFCFNIASQKIIGSKPNQLYDVDCHLQKINAENNNIFLGHEGGFSVFNSSEFVHPVAAKPVAFLSNLKVNNSEVSLNRNSSHIHPLKLEYFENQLSFDLSAIEFNYPEDVVYQYKLIGIDKGWMNAGLKRSISYSHLPPGKYDFAFFVSNKKTGNRSAMGNFAFVIDPAWWQYWWFWPLIAFIFAAAVLFFARRRVQAIRQKEKHRTAINKAMAELETKMLRSQMNPHFIFNSLNSIQKYIWENKEEDAAEYLAKFAKLMRAILENSREETISVGEEMEVMKLYVDLEHRRSNAGFDYSIKAEPHLIEQNILMPPLIMQPFIENAIWHGLNKKDSKGNLSISLFEKEGSLVCEIDDDGVGRLHPKESFGADKKSLGIKITQQRIEKLVETTGQSANIQIKDKTTDGLASGTTVTITLPLQTA